jgi:uncharacterized protein
MSGLLPAQINPIRLADEGARLEGELPGSQFRRLQEQSRLTTRAAPVQVELEFSRTSHGMRIMHGVIRTTVEVTCQRCLQAFALAVTAEPYFVLLMPDEEPPQGPEEAETLVVEGPVSLRELVEDELLLAMPMIPMHGEGQCTAPGVSAETPEAGVSSKPNPFAVLRGFKDK